jgi:mannose-6-phosphate isomerase-like protein (cupin superfamily)
MNRSKGEESMKVLFASTAVLVATVLVAWSAGSSTVTFVNHDKVAAALTKGGPLVTASDLLVSGSHRTGAGHVEVHDKETDVLYVTDGGATFVTGGSMVGGKTTTPGQWAGTSIDGGETHQLAKGDVIVIPAGTPHWFKEVPQSISYFVVKVVKQ